MRAILVGVGVASLSACNAIGGCDTRPFGEIDATERSEDLTAQAAGLAAAVGTWTAVSEGRTLTLTLSTEVDAIEVDLGGELCGGGGGAAASSIQFDTSPTVTDAAGACNLVVGGEPAWCEFETTEGAWSLEVDAGTIRASFAPALVGASGDQGVVVEGWEPAE